MSRRAMKRPMHAANGHDLQMKGVVGTNQGRFNGKTRSDWANVKDDQRTNFGTGATVPDSVALN